MFFGSNRRFLLLLLLLWSPFVHSISVEKQKNFKLLTMVFPGRVCLLKWFCNFVNLFLFFSIFYGRILFIWITTIYVDVGSYLLHTNRRKNNDRFFKIYLIKFDTIFFLCMIQDRYEYTITKSSCMDILFALFLMTLQLCLTFSWQHEWEEELERKKLKT